MAEVQEPEERCVRAIGSRDRAYRGERDSEPDTGNHVQPRQTPAMPDSFGKESWPA